MIPRQAKDAAFAIARLIFEKPLPRNDYSLFEAIWDEIEAGQPTYGRFSWTRWIQTQPKDTNYWYARVRTMCFRELAKKEAYRKEMSLSQGRS